MSWRSDPVFREVRDEAGATAHGYYRAVDEACEAAVAARDRELAREIENLPAPDEDGIYVWALDVLVLLEPEGAA